MDVESNIDREKYHNRYLLIIKEIQSRISSNNFELNQNWLYYNGKPFLKYPIRMNLKFIAIINLILPIIFLISFITFYISGIIFPINIFNILVKFCICTWFLSLILTGIYTNKVRYNFTNNWATREHDPVNFWLVIMMLLTLTLFLLVF